MIAGSILKALMIDTIDVIREIIITNRRVNIVEIIYILAPSTSNILLFIIMTNSNYPPAKDIIATF